MASSLSMLSKVVEMLFYPVPPEKHFNVKYFYTNWHAKIGQAYPQGPIAQLFLFVLLLYILISEN